MIIKLEIAAKKLNLQEKLLKIWGGTDFQVRQNTRVGDDEDDKISSKGQFGALKSNPCKSVQKFSVFPRFFFFSFCPIPPLLIYGVDVDTIISNILTKFFLHFVSWII